MILRLLAHLPIRAALVAVAATGIAAGLTLEARHGGGDVSADPQYGTVRPSPANGFIIEGHRVSIPVGFTTCTTPTNTSCRLGAYEVKMQYDPAKVTVISASGLSSGGNTSTTFNDTSQTWKVNQWVGSRITLTGGIGYAGADGNPQSRIVVSNTAHTLTISPPWDGGVIPLPTNFTAYTLGGITDAGWLGSTGRIISCPGGPTYGSNWADLHCVSFDDVPAGPTGAGNLVNLTVEAGFTRGLFTVTLLTPTTRVLRIDGYDIPADVLNGTRRVILCPDPTNDGQVNVVDMQQIAAAIGSGTGDPLYAVKKDPDENGTINVIDLQMAAGVYGKKCVQV